MESHADKEVNALPQRVDRDAERRRNRTTRALGPQIDITEFSVHSRLVRCFLLLHQRIVRPDSSEPRGLHDCLEHSVYRPWVSLSDATVWKVAQLNQHELEVRQRIETLVESVKDDQARSQQLFHYVWTMICVHRGLMRVVREVRSREGIQLVLEEVKTGRHRLVSRPVELDREVEGLAVQALTKILGEIDVAPGNRTLRTPGIPGTGTSPIREA